MLLDILEDEACHVSEAQQTALQLVSTANPFTKVALTQRSRVIAFDSSIILIRPKLWLANEDNYYETR